MDIISTSDCKVSFKAEDYQSHSIHIVSKYQSGLFSSKLIPVQELEVNLKDRNLRVEYSLLNDAAKSSKEIIEQIKNFNNEKRT